MRIRYAPAVLVLTAVLLLAGPSSAALRTVSISVTESISPSTVPPGGNFTISFSAKNTGDTAQAPFSLVLFLGPGSWSVGSPNDGCSRPDQYDIDCERTSLGPGETFSSSVTVTLGSDAPPGAIYNSRAFAFPGGTSGGSLGGDARSIQIAPAPPPPPPPPGPSTLSVALRGSGAGTVISSPAGINCGSACALQFAHGTAVTLTAAPAAGSVFTGWGDACAAAAQNAQCAVAVNSDTAVSATFDLAPVTTTTAAPPPPPPGPKACTVPRLLGLTLAAAKLRLARGDCTLGTVSKRKAKPHQLGRVVAQRPAAGEYLAVHGKVAVVLGKRA